MIEVVAAIIRDEEGKILIAQRNLKKSQGGLWEFPGGKIEKDETMEHAIEREIKEEFNMDIKAESYYAEKVYEYPEKTIKLIAINCSMISNEYTLLEHEQVAWITKDDVNKYEFAPADIYFVNKIFD